MSSWVYAHPDPFSSGSTRFELPLTQAAIMNESSASAASIVTDVFGHNFSPSRSTETMRLCTSPDWRNTTKTDSFAFKDRGIVVTPSLSSKNITGSMAGLRPIQFGLFAGDAKGAACLQECSLLIHNEINVPPIRCLAMCIVKFLFRIRAASKIRWYPHSR